MANGGIEWIDTLFDWAVIALIEAAKLIGITYEEINVWLFVILWPAMTLLMTVVIFMQWRNNKQLRHQIHAQ
jgi:hypothetical protein